MHLQAVFSLKPLVLGQGADMFGGSRTQSPDKNRLPAPLRRLRFPVITAGQSAEMPKTRLLTTVLPRIILFAMLPKDTEIPWN